MVQPSESLLSEDPTRSYGTNPAVRRPLLKSEMCSVLTMVTNVLREQSFQMAFIQCNHVVQEVSSDRAPRDRPHKFGITLCSPGGSVL